MEGFAKAIEAFCQSVRLRFENDAREMVKFQNEVMEAFKARDQALLITQKVVVNLEKKIKELESNAVDKIILQESKEVGKP